MSSFKDILEWLFILICFWIALWIVVTITISIVLFATKLFGL